MHRRRTRTRLSHSEALEVRALLTGNMTAELVGDTYELTGDTADNSVALYLDGDEAVLQGLDGTTINGEPELRVPRTALDSADNFRARGRGGNDDMFIDFTGFTWNGRAVINAGGGNDSMTVVGGTVDTDLKVGGGSGRDSLAIRNMEVTANMQILSGEGRDTVMLNDNQVGSQLLYYGNGGDDFLWMDGVTVGGNAFLRMGKGDDWSVLSETTVDGDAIVNGQGGTAATFVDDESSNNFGTSVELNITQKFTALEDWSDAEPPEDTFTESDSRVDAHFEIVDTNAVGIPDAVRQNLLDVFGDSLPDLFF